MSFPEQVKAVIFDVDGVVVNSELIFLNSATRYLERHGVHPKLPQLTRFLGKSEAYAAMTVANEMLEGRVTPEEAREGIYGEGCGYEELGHLDPMPGLPEFLSWMRRNDMPAAIATSGTAARVDLVVGGAGCLDAFDVIATVDDTGVCKPDPAIFNVAAERLEQQGIARSHMIAVEALPIGTTFGHHLPCSLLRGEMESPRTRLFLIQRQLLGRLPLIASGSRLRAGRIARQQDSQNESQDLHR